MGAEELRPRAGRGIEYLGPSLDLYLGCGRMKESNGKGQGIKEIAEKLGLDYQVVWRGSAKGYIKHDEKGKVDLAATRQAFEENQGKKHLGSQAGNRVYYEEYWKIKSAILRQKFLEMRGELVPIQDVRSAIIKRELIFKDQLLGMAREIVPRLIGKKGRQMEEILHQKAEQMLNELIEGFNDEITNKAAKASR